jgi:hypothetical protein
MPHHGIKPKFYVSHWMQHRVRPRETRSLLNKGLNEAQPLAWRPRGALRAGQVEVGHDGSDRLETHHHRPHLALCLLPGTTQHSVWNLIHRAP